MQVDARERQDGIWAAAPSRLRGRIAEKGERGAVRHTTRRKMRRGRRREGWEDRMGDEGEKGSKRG
eukprot:2878698-Pyramimonas_sp.AAC.1